MPHLWWSNEAQNSVQTWKRHCLMLASGELDLLFPTDCPPPPPPCLCQHYNECNAFNPNLWLLCESGDGCYGPQRGWGWRKLWSVSSRRCAESGRRRKTWRDRTWRRQQRAVRCSDRRGTLFIAQSQSLSFIIALRSPWTQSRRGSLRFVWGTEVSPQRSAVLHRICYQDEESENSINIKTVFWVNGIKKSLSSPNCDH